MVGSALTGAKRKILSLPLQHTFANHSTRLVRQIHALVELVEGKAMSEAAELLGTSDQTVRDGLHGSALNGAASPYYRPHPDRPPGDRLGPTAKVVDVTSSKSFQ